MTSQPGNEEYVGVEKIVIGPHIIFGRNGAGVGNTSPDGEGVAPAESLKPDRSELWMDSFSLN